MLDYQSDLAALKTVERSELLREFTDYLKDRKLIRDTESPPEGLEDRIEDALNKSRERHLRLNQIAYGLSRAAAMVRAKLG